MEESSGFDRPVVDRTSEPESVPSMIPSHFGDMDLETYLRHKGGGENRLRTEYCAQPWALREGDVLANGDVVLAPPLEAGNGGVELLLTGGRSGHRIRVPARIPIALAPNPDEVMKR